MSKKTWNRYRPDEIATLRRMHAEGASREAMALALRRGTQSVAHKCNELGLLPHVAPTPWTEERIAELRRLWDAGWSGTAIGRKLALSKSACIGKAHRLGLKPRLSPIRLRAKVAAPPEMANEARGPGRPQKEADNIRLACSAPDGPCEPEQAAERPCQWPIGEPGEPDFMFCGREARPGKSYCAEHHARAYAGKPQADKAA